MDLTFSPEQEAFRPEARAWLTAHVPTAGPSPPSTRHAGFAAAPGLGAHPVRPTAGRWSAGPPSTAAATSASSEWLVFEEEYYRARAPKRVSQNGIFLLAPTLLEYGTDEQKARFLPPMAAGDEIWCQGWSEPDAGSDLAGIRIPRRAATPPATAGCSSGQKTWASRGAFADWCFGIFRTDPEAERHRGLTYFLIPMDAPGVTVRPIPQIDGETGFAEIFFDNVEVPDDQVLGDEGAGWSVAMSTAGSERGLSLRSPARYTEAADRLVELFDSARRTHRPSAADAVAQAYIDAEAYKLHTYWTATKVTDGHAVGPEASCNKIFWSETDLAIHEAAPGPARPRGRAPATAGAPGRVARRLPLRAGRADLRRHQRDPAQRRGRAPPRAAPGLDRMDFAFTEQQLELRQAVRQVLDDECPVDLAARLRCGHRPTSGAARPAGAAGPCWPSWARRPPRARVSRRARAATTSIWSVYSRKPGGPPSPNRCSRRPDRRTRAGHACCPTPAARPPSPCAGRSPT